MYLPRNSIVCSCTILSTTFKWWKGDWTVILGIRFRKPFLKEGFNNCFFAGVRKSTGRNWQIVLVWLIAMHRLLERFLKDHWCLEPYFHQFFLVFWIPYSIQFLEMVTFSSNWISCNSYSLIVFQNYSESLVVLTQSFPVMRSNKFPLLTVSQMINHFCLLNIYSIENSFFPQSQWF